MQPATEKPKNIVLCSDGTGNTANKDRGTNVFKIFEAVDVNGHKFDDALKPQVAFYDDGVGTQRFKILKIICGASGLGLTRNVKELYRELARVYNPQDHIYLFGFSRGAYTVRTLAEFIVHLGLPKPESYETERQFGRLVDQAYSNYRQRYPSLLGSAFARTKPVDPAWFHQSVPIQFLGVWDTVAAVGLPFKELTDLWNKVIYCFTFKDHKLSGQVHKACHALAIDDERKTFHPVMWDEAGESGGRIEQVWFSGVHSNVGGGYPKQGMSLVTLHWMMKRAYQAGLRFLDADWDHYRDHRNVNGKLYNSRSGLAVYYRYLPRDIQQICDKFHTPIRIHISALERIGQGTEGYAPRVLPDEFTVVADKTGWDDQRSLSHKINENPPPETTLMECLHALIQWRQAGYYLFLGITLLGIVLLICDDSLRRGWLGILGAWSSFEIFNRELYEFLISKEGGPTRHLAQSLGLILGWLLGFGISRMAQSAITDRCTAFWHGRQHTLRDALKNTWQSIRD